MQGRCKMDPQQGGSRGQKVGVKGVEENDENRGEEGKRKKRGSGKEGMEKGDGRASMVRNMWRGRDERIKWDGATTVTIKCSIRTPV